ncbi:MAG TPA: D-alanine--D-alanine ligase family protein [Solirubrobacterales bacterium]|jgi:D-alanine-D-alanine ligase
MRVAVISGGRSSEHEVSLRSGESVAAGLQEAGHEVLRILIDRDGRWLMNGEELDLRPAGGLAGADVAFPVLHGPFGEDGTVQGLLECLDIPYAGPGVLGAAVAMDKLVCKRLLAFHGLPQVDFCEAGEPGWRERVESFGTPVWVKPSRLGSSVGISRVDDLADLDEAIEEARRHDPRVIVEAHAEAREVECSVIGNDEPETSLPGEIVTVGHEWYDYEAKYSEGGMQLRVPAPIGEEAIARVRELAARVYRAIGGCGMARCDFFYVERSGELLVNEINTIPGFTSTSVFGKLFEASGVPYPRLCDRLVRLAVERHERERSYQF